MNYRELKWGALKSYATKLGINTKGMTKEVLLEWLDAMPDVAHGIEELKPFKGIKQHHPLFDEIKDYLPYLKAYKKLNAVSRDHIETQKNAKVNIGCGRCVNSYYQRMVANYNKLVDEYGGDKI
jgi:hypothetical protein